MGNGKEFTEYVNTPLSRTSIDLIYSSNFIMYERCELYMDFVITLLNQIFNTYMGDDITDSEQQTNHFRWCWVRTIMDFESENIYFTHQDDLYLFLHDYIFEAYYTKDKDIAIKYGIVYYWTRLFNYDVIKTRSDVDNLVLIYKLFEKSLIRGKKN